MPRNLCPLQPFAGTVVVDRDFTNDDKSAKDFARAACGQITPADPKISANALVAFSDASARERAAEPAACWCSCAVAWRMYGETTWETEGEPLPDLRESANSELKGVVKMLSKAEHITASYDTTTTTTTNTNTNTTTTTISPAAAATPAAKIESLYGFCDNEAAVVQFRDLGRHPGGSKWPAKLDKRLLREGFALAEKLEARGIRVHLHWVRGHRNVEGNALGDEVAAANRPDVLQPFLHPVKWRCSGRSAKSLAPAERERERRREQEGLRVGFSIAAANRRLSRAWPFTLLKKRMKWLKRREKAGLPGVAEKMRDVRYAWEHTAEDEARALPFRILPSVAPARTVDEAVGESWEEEDEDDDNDDDDDDDDTMCLE